VLAGHPRVGIWLGMALLAGSLCWMLQGWLPPRWALAGTVLAVGRLLIASRNFETVGYWAHSYWGGAVAATGGALLFGALRRLVRRPALGQGVVLGLGLVILANTRPFEGLVASLPAGVVLLVALLRRGGKALLRVALGAAGVLVPAGLAMAAYNAAVTGDFREMPYLRHEQTYAITPQFLWQPLRPSPPYNHELLRSFWTGWAPQAYREQQTLAGLARHLGIKILVLWVFFLGSVQTVMLLGLLSCSPRALLVAQASRLCPDTGGTPVPRGERDRWPWFALAVCGLLLIALLLEQGVLPHYAAPVTGLLAYLVIQGWRRLRLVRPGWRAVGPGLVVVVLLVWGFSLRFALSSDHREGWFQDRARLVEELERIPGQHLVLVRYRPDHEAHCEWVYNGADLEGARVIWARELGEERDRCLREHYSGRAVWLLEADVAPPRLVPYSQTCEVEKSRGF
jgi:hypothetical protein